MDHTPRYRILDLPDGRTIEAPTGIRALVAYIQTARTNRDRLQERANQYNQEVVALENLLQELTENT